MKKNYPAPPILPKNFSEDFYLEDEATIEDVHGTDFDYSYLTCENLVLRRSILEKITMQRTKLYRFEASNVISQIWNGSVAAFIRLFLKAVN